MRPANYLSCFVWPGAEVTDDRVRLGVELRFEGGGDGVGERVGGEDGALLGRERAVAEGEGGGAADGEEGGGAAALGASCESEGGARERESSQAPPKSSRTPEAIYK